ncbi:MAG: carbohydrate ABC transporter permease [bacterium]|jgi:multiple sugar transport system permease protein
MAGGVADPAGSRARARRIRAAVLYAVLTLAAIVVLFPFFWMLVTAFKMPGHAFDPEILPRPATLENFKKVFTEYGFIRYFMNSGIVAVSAGALATLFAALAAYAFVFKDFRGRDKVFAVIIASMMVPGLMYVVPQFAIVKKLGWMNTYRAMVVPHLANAFGLFLLRQYMVTIPRSLIDAARIDGAGDFQVFGRIVVPLTLPVIATLFLLTFQFHWSNFLWQLIVANRESLYTVPVGLAMFKQQHEQLYTLKMAASAVSIIPISVIFVFAQKYFIEGVTRGAVKG